MTYTSARSINCPNSVSSQHTSWLEAESRPEVGCKHIEHRENLNRRHKSHLVEEEDPRVRHQFHSDIHSFPLTTADSSS